MSKIEDLNKQNGNTPGTSLNSSDVETGGSKKTKKKVHFAFSLRDDIQNLAATIKVRK